MRSESRHRVRPVDSRRVLLERIGIVAIIAVVVVAGWSFMGSPARITGPSGSAGAVVATATAGSSTGDLAGGGSTVPSSSSPASVQPTNGTQESPFPNGLLIADRANDRLLAVDNAGHILWRFPHAGGLPAGQGFSADDAFIAPDLKTIVANDEFHQVIDRIDITTGRIVWQYGHYGVGGSQRGYLHTPDDAYPLANGDVVVADIENCRILEIAPNKSIIRQWGRTGDCRDAPPAAFARPNGDTPLPDGGLLITEITGSRVVRLSADGAVVFDIHVPVTYPSDAQLDARGNVVVADFSTHGQVVAVNPTTDAVIWRYAPTSGPGRLDHPSLATPLADGTVSVNDDFRHRIVVFDPATGKIVWQYGHTDRAAAAAGYLNTPDGHEPLPPGIAWPQST